MCVPDFEEIPVNPEDSDNEHNMSDEMVEMYHEEFDEDYDPNY